MENSVVTEPGRRVAAIFHDFTFLKLKGNGLTSIFVFSPFRQFESVCTIYYTRNAIRSWEQGVSLYDYRKKESIQRQKGKFLLCLTLNHLSHTIYQSYQLKRLSSEENFVVTEPGCRVAAIFHVFTVLRLAGSRLTSIFVCSPSRQFIERRTAK